MLDILYLIMGGSMAGYIILTEPTFYIRFWVALSFGALVALFWLVVLPYHKDKQDETEDELFSQIDLINR